MTFRRVMLVLLPLLAAVFVFMLLRHLWSDYLASLEAETPVFETGPVERLRGKESIQVTEQVGHEATTNLNLVQKDETGRAELQLLADRVEHIRTNTFDITRPRFLYFTRAGETITLTAEQAQLVSTSDRFAAIEDIRSGTVRGQVVVTHDRGTPDDTLDDLVFGVDRLHFTSDAYELRTDDDVVLVAPEVMLTARGMELALDRETRRVAKLTFVEDVVLVIETEGEMGLGLAEGEGHGTAAPAPPSAAPRAGGVEPLAAPGAAAETPSADAPPPPPAADAPEGDVWRIDLTGRVDACQLEGRLLADALRLYYASDADAFGQAPAGGAGSDRPATSGDGPFIPHAAETEGARAASPPRAGGPAGARAPSPGTDAAPDEVPPLLHVLADGPLVFTPLTPDELADLGDGRHVMTATGDPVRLTDGPLRVTGTEVAYNLKTRAGRVEGGDGGIRLVEGDRLELTGGRLTFDREAPTATVEGRGTLRTEVATSSLTGGVVEAEPADPAGAGERPLTARWTRRMALAFYPPRDGQGTISDIRRAVFEGAADVRAEGGFLTGDRLQLDFFPGAAGRRTLDAPDLPGADEARVRAWHVRPGQAVTEGQPLATLTGAGRRYDLRAPGDGRLGAIVAPVGARVRPGMPLAELSVRVGQAVQRIAGQGDVHIHNAASGSADDGAQALTGQVGDIRARDLDIAFLRRRDGKSDPHRLDAAGDVAIDDAQGKVRAQDLTLRFARDDAGKLDATYVEAEGDVLVRREDLRAEGTYLKRDLERGQMILDGTPAEARREGERIKAAHIEFDETTGRARATGAGELELRVTTDLRGRPRAEPVPLLIDWQKEMRLEREANFAVFFGDVHAATGTSRLGADTLWVYLEDAEPGAAPPPAADSGGGAARLAGDKAIQRVFAEGKVTAVEQDFAPEGGLEFRMEMHGRDLTYVQASGDLFSRQPGDLAILAYESRSEAPRLTGKAVEPFASGPPPRGYARTTVAWQEAMKFEGGSNRAYFRGDVVAGHAGRSAPGRTGAAGAGGRRVTETRLRSSDLILVFREGQGGDGGAGLAGPAEGMQLEKMLAGGGVSLAVGERRGSGERLLYQRDPEVLHLYSGPARWARMWQESEARQEFGLVVARDIIFMPGTDEVRLIDQQEITASPEP